MPAWIQGTAFDVARPKHVATCMGDSNVHVWIVVALLREMAGLEGRATFRKCGVYVPVHKMHPTRECAESSALAQDGDEDIVECG